MNAAIAGALTTYVTTTALNTTLAGYTDTTGLSNLLATKQDVLTAGANISIVGSTISSTPLTLQLDGVTQAGATTLNFVANTASFANNVLNVSRMTYQDALTLRYSTAASDKDLTQGSQGELLWNGGEVQLRQNAFHSISVASPLTVSGANSIVIDTLWKPSSVTGGYGINTQAVDAVGTLTLAADTNTIATVSSLTAGLNGKQDTLVAGSNITLNGNTISAASGATQAWVTANFLSPLNPYTVGVTAGLSSVMTANTWIISVDESTDSRTLFTLRDSGNAARDITASSSGQLLYDGGALATETQLQTKQNTLTNGDGIFLSGNTISSFSLRWDTNNVPQAPIQCLHFKNQTITQNLNLNTSQAELVIEPPTSIQYIEPSLSGLSLGSSQYPSNATHRIACFEQLAGSGFPASSYFYGIGLTTLGASPGVGIWGGTLGNLPNQDNNTGTVDPHMNVCANGRVGINQHSPAYTLDVTGDIHASGTVSATTKSFDIQHPDPSKPGQRLRHWCYEGDSPGGSLIYRRTVTMDSSHATLTMPDWFEHLAKNVTIHMTPFEHFGSAWGRCDGNSIELHATTTGQWHVLIMADRKDVCATTMCPQEVEYTEQPSHSAHHFPTP